MAFVFFAAELYATAVLVYVRAPPAAPTIGLFTAFLTIISARAVYVPPSSSSSSFSFHPIPPITQLTRPVYKYIYRVSCQPDAFLKSVLFQTVWPRELPPLLPSRPCADY